MTFRAGKFSYVLIQSFRGENKHHFLRFQAKKIFLECVCEKCLKIKMPGYVWSLTKMFEARSYLETKLNYPVLLRRIR